MNYSIQTDPIAIKVFSIKDTTKCPNGTNSNGNIIIIVVSIVSAIVVIAIIFLIVSFSVPKYRRFFLPTLAAEHTIKKIQEKNDQNK